MPKRIDKRDEAGDLIYSINPSAKTGTYRVSDDSSQFKYCERVRLRGFDKLPTGFYTRKGFGLSGVGPYLLQAIQEKYQKKIALTLTSKGKNSISTGKAKVNLTLRHTDLAELNDSVKLVKRQKNQQIASEVATFLGSSFPKRFPQKKKPKTTYLGGTMAKVVRQKGLFAGLTLDDKRRLELFIPDYLSRVEGSLRAKKRLQVVIDTIKAGRKVYLSKVVEDFKNKLKAKTHSESAWQNFLSTYILLLRNSYAQVLEKKNVSLEGKYPDFVLVDPYGYIDVYEIKTPSTTLLNYDGSRKNHYWSTELSKAISQVENYLYQIERYSDKLTTDIRKAKGLDITIVRPRGYIIAGVRSQLTTPKMKDDFRILNESLKNIDVLFYDDLLANLESFLQKVA